MNFGDIASNAKDLKLKKGPKAGKASSATSVSLVLGSGGWGLGAGAVCVSMWGGCIRFSAASLPLLSNMVRLQSGAEFGRDQAVQAVFQDFRQGSERLGGFVGVAVGAGGHGTEPVRPGGEDIDG